MNNPVIELMANHGSVRKYRPDPVPPETVSQIVYAAQRASTSSNLQMWTVIAVTESERRARLAEHFGLTPAQLDRLHGPVGLDICARTPPEIALSILAEMTAVRYRAGGARAEAGCVL